MAYISQGKRRGKNYKLSGWINPKQRCELKSATMQKTLDFQRSS